MDKLRKFADAVYNGWTRAGSLVQRFPRTALAIIIVLALIVAVR